MKPNKKMYAHKWDYTTRSRVAECLNCGICYSAAGFSSCPMQKPVVAQQNQQSLPQTPPQTKLWNSPHLFIYKYSSIDMWCQYCNEEKDDWLKRGCPHDCPRRIVLQPISQQVTPQPPLPGHQHNVRSSVSLGIDNCSCGTGVWLYDPFINKFNCVSCGKSQSKSDSPNTSIKSSGCYHEWVKYTGLNEQFEYCRICDLKR